MKFEIILEEDYRERDFQKPYLYYLAVRLILEYFEEYENSSLHNKLREEYYVTFTFKFGRLEDPNHELSNNSIMF